MRGRDEYTRRQRLRDGFGVFFGRRVAGAAFVFGLFVFVGLVARVGLS